MYIEDALKLTDPKQIEQEIKDLKELRERMVGDLYPHIVTSQIHRLYERLEEIRKL